MKMFKKLLVANRGEIAIRIFRAATELHIRTVAVFTYEDRYSLHRYKADEAYQIGENDEPLKPYLNIEEIIRVAKAHGADAIHPGYGFLSENSTFVRRCNEEGITFIGPSVHAMENLGDKVAAKAIARKAGVPVIEDSIHALTSEALALSEALRIGFPIMIKAAAGGGGRGMRVVRTESDLIKNFQEARREAGNAFGDDTVFFEKFIDQPKHIEVQLLGDQHGQLVHLYERDCSVQRRFQKVVEVAPAASLKRETREKLHEYALAMGRAVDYSNAGTVEFLVDKNETIFFIEVNPRIQVEHTITEEITGIDIVRTQIQIAQGIALSDPSIRINKQEDIRCEGHAIQCRITTEDPANGFKPDYGTIIAYRNAAGFGIRLDEGSSYPGVKISPFFDSMLVKVSAWGRSKQGASDRLVRALKEFRIRGVKTNIAFLQNVLEHPDFIRGDVSVQFLESNPGLFAVKKQQDRGTKLLRYLAEVAVNGNPDVASVNSAKVFRSPRIPKPHIETLPDGFKQKLNQFGADGLMQWLKAEKAIQYTDTTFRDAHQSLLATRVRTQDMVRVAEHFAKHHPQVFSMEVWGGATFDVALRFLHECPWQRLDLLREAMPNMLLQMLFRGSNGVGYTAYPDNVNIDFIQRAAESGVDIFRIFDSLNWVKALRTSIHTVRNKTGAIAEACIGYTGDITDPTRTKYTLKYYIDLAKELEAEGAHMLGIKDMAGLLKPFAAERLINELKQHINIPIHLHTHDTAGIQSAMYLKAVEAGVDVMDVALSSMSGTTSQPNFNSLVSMMQGHERENPINLHTLNEHSNYWEDIRELYYPFEAELKSSTAEVYENEIPGGQYSNLRPQARGLGLEEQFDTIKANFKIANKLFGDIVKVTPSSKVVGDMAMFMTANHYTENDILTKGQSLSFPESVKGMMRGDLGQPYGGFPEHIQQLILKDEKPYTDLPNAHMAPANLEEEFKLFLNDYGTQYNYRDFLSYKNYPKVFADYHQHLEMYGDLSVLPTQHFFYPMKTNEEILVEIGQGKSLLIRFMYMSEADAEGNRHVFFKLNGQTRDLLVRDRSIKFLDVKHIKATDSHQVGAPLQGLLAKVLVKPGDTVKRNQPLFIIEAMKMETNVVANADGVVSKVHLSDATMVEQDDCVLEFE